MTTRRAASGWVKQASRWKRLRVSVYCPAKREDVQIGGKKNLGAGERPDSRVQVKEDQPAGPQAAASHTVQTTMSRKGQMQ
jgi:hypothetical protein